VAQRDTQRVGEKIRHGFEWTADIPTGATITDSAYESEPPTGLTLTDEQVAGTQTSVMVQATAPGVYELINEVTLSDGSVIYQSLILSVVAKIETSDTGGNPVYPTAEELLAMLPAGGEPLTLVDAELHRQRWISSLAFQPVSNPQTDEEKRIASLAQMVVEDGTLAALEAKQLRESGRTVPTEVYDRINAARDYRKEYNALAPTEDTFDEPVVYVEDFG